MINSARQGMPADAVNIHATVIVLGDRGVAITGASGAGKTSLALSLLRYFQLNGHFASLVGDDQVFVAGRSGRLVAYAPAAIAGLAEVRGLGPVALPHEAACVVDLVLELTAELEPPRYWAGETATVAGSIVPLFRIAGRNQAANLAAIEKIVASVLRPNDQVPANR